MALSYVCLKVCVLENVLYLVDTNFAEFDVQKHAEKKLEVMQERLKRQLHL